MTGCQRSEDSSFMDEAVNLPAFLRPQTLACAHRFWKGTGKGDMSRGKAVNVSKQRLAA